MNGRAYRILLVPRETHQDPFSELMLESLGKRGAGVADSSRALCVMQPAYVFSRYTVRCKLRDSCRALPAARIAVRQGPDIGYQLRSFVTPTSHDIF